jgi:hypothetical protein
VRQSCFVAETPTPARQNAHTNISYIPNFRDRNIVSLVDFHQRRTESPTYLQGQTSGTSQGAHRDRSSRPSMGIALAASSTVCGAQGGDTRGSDSSMMRQERQDSSSDNQNNSRRPAAPDPDSSDTSTSSEETSASNGPPRSTQSTPPGRSRRQSNSGINERMAVCMEQMTDIVIHNNRPSQNDRSYSSTTEVFTDDLPDIESKKSFYKECDASVN